MFVQKQTLTMETKHTENMQFHQTMCVLKDACRIIKHCCEHIIQHIAEPVLNRLMAGMFPQNCKLPKNRAPSCFFSVHQGLSYCCFSRQNLVPTESGSLHLFIYLLKCHI